jgi:hypothetical protein
LTTCVTVERGRPISCADHGEAAPFDDPHEQPHGIDPVQTHRLIVYIVGTVIAHLRVIISRLSSVK